MRSSGERRAARFFPDFPEKPEGVYCLDKEAVVLHRVGFSEYYCPIKTGSGFQTLGGTPIPKDGSSTPPPGENSARKCFFFSFVCVLCDWPE